MDHVMSCHDWSGCRASLLVKQNCFDLDTAFSTASLVYRIQYSCQARCWYRDFGASTAYLVVRSPTQAIFELFDSLLIMQRGRTVYFGPNSSVALNYFSSLEGVCILFWLLLLLLFSSSSFQYTPLFFNCVHVEPANHTLRVIKEGTQQRQWAVKYMGGYCELASSQFSTCCRTSLTRPHKEAAQRGDKLVRFCFFWTPYYVWLPYTIMQAGLAEVIIFRFWQVKYV